MTNQTIITITEMPSMPGRYVYALMVNRRRISTGHDAGRDPAAAAAKAIELAINHPGQYLIIGPEKVMLNIPESIRSGMISK